MTILSEVKDSILWLLADNEAAEINLKNQAKTHGILPDRLIFSSRMPLTKHLARHKQADLFLDTFPCNAHTTASDALWAGLPLLTQQGQTFPGRVAASLLQAIGLPELIAKNRDEYVALAIEYGKNAEKLAQIKQKLASNRLTTPLFNTAEFTTHLENIFSQMVARQHAKLVPADIHIS